MMNADNKQMYSLMSLVLAHERFPGVSTIKGFS